MKRFSSVILMLLLCISCDTEDSDLKNVDFFMGTWELKTFLYQGDIGISVPSEVTITFNDESKTLTFNGYSSCNNYGGVVPKITTQQISLTDIFATEIACPGEIGSFESLYFETLDQINRYRIENGQLILFYGNTFLTFEKGTGS